ncbi:MAG: hypothetical protein IT547_17415 [Hyphomonadaceae bacterium]|nr:hypothetical protein [Hyphomonadaceae bacterium]
MASITQPIGAIAPAPRSGMFGEILALAAYVASIGLAVAHLYAGGLEALAGALLGLGAGAVSALHRSKTQTLAAKLSRAFETSFAAMWAAMMLAGLLHDPLHNLFDMAFRALS